MWVIPAFLSFATSSSHNADSYPIHIDPASASRAKNIYLIRSTFSNDPCRAHPQKGDGFPSPTLHFPTIPAQTNLAYCLPRKYSPTEFEPFLRAFLQAF